MRVEKTELKGVLAVQPPTLFEDYRGEYVELYNRDLYAGAGIDQIFIQDDISVSSRNVLRGIHGDGITWKLISCLLGRFYLVVVNNVAGSAQYRQWQSFTISDRNRKQVLVPPSFGLGHLVLSEQAIFHYKQTTHYDRSSQFTLRWDDPGLAIDWPVRDPVLSRRDRGLE